VQSSALKEAFEDLEWPGSSIQIALNPEPPVVTFRGEGHGDLQVSMANGKSQRYMHTLCWAFAYDFGPSIQNHCFLDSDWLTKLSLGVA
jgi:hypothetical protein